MRGFVATKKATTIDRRQGNRLLTDIQKHKWVYLLAVPVILYYVAFCYTPMFGIIIAFKNYSPAKGIFASPWASQYGFGHFISFVQNPYFFRLVRNTLMISFYDILFTFPAPILFALLLNEVRCEPFKRTVQTLTYLPHFISLMVVCGLIKTFVGTDGLINDILVFFGGTRSNLLTKPELFRPIYIISNIWQQIGWDSILYLAALSGIDPQLYEAATIDGASRFSKMWHVTLPGILPTVVIMLILKLGSLFSVGYEKIILLYSEMTYETADVISSFVYRRGIIDTDYSFSTAVGLMNSIVNFIVIYLANFVSRRVGETSLW